MRPDVLRLERREARRRQLRVLLERRGAAEVCRRTEQGITERMSEQQGQVPMPGDGAIVVVGPDGQPVQLVPGGPGAPGASGDGGRGQLAGQVEQPAKVMRIGTMIRQLLDEVRNAPLDEAGRARLAEIHRRSIDELEEGLAPELVEELDRLSLPFTEGSVPSEAELRVAQAQLVGWLEGLFHGIQTALFAQQMAARAQFEEMRRRALPGRPGLRMPPQEQAGDGSTGQYL